MDSDGGVRQSVRENKLKWGLVVGKVAAAVFFALNYAVLKIELNEMGCRYAVQYVSGGVIQ